PEGFTISQDVKNIISFKRLNLLEPWPFTAMFDFIFCRNVIIYFDKATKLALISRFASQLAPGGLLFLGHSETLVSAIPNLKSLGKTTYQRELA
ncbi:MAG: CheR family methyltransferase, partial [Pseudomonadota bacterium]